MCFRKIYEGGYQNHDEAASNICHGRAVGYPQISKDLVRRWNLQADSAPLRAAAEHKCVRKEGPTDVRQVLLVLALTSGLRKNDYKKVYNTFEFIFCKNLSRN